jgi:hypothetical protein
MTGDKSENPVEEQTAHLRKPWVEPSVTELRAGSAENSPGSRISDATLETIGS